MTNLIDTIHGLGTFTTFTRALEMSALALTLREPGAYTVFAPTVHAEMVVRNIKKTCSRRETI